MATWHFTRRVEAVPCLSWAIIKVQTFVPAAHLRDVWLIDFYRMFQVAGSSTRLLFLLLLAVGLLTHPLAAQQRAVTLVAEPKVQVGLDGLARPGGWTPLRLTLENSSSEPLQVHCRWTLTDADGDIVLANRTVTLSARRRQSVWLYAALPLAGGAGVQQWVVHIIDARRNQVLVTELVSPGRMVSPTSKVIGVTSSLPLGLQGFADEPYTRQEKVEILRGLSPSLLPDRWYGLSVLDALIWTPDAGTLGDKAEGDPNNPAITAETRSAILEWVRRGGHIVIVLPGIGDPWTSSPFKDLLGPVQTTTITDAPAPLWLGEPLADNRLKVDVKALDPGDTPFSAATVLYRDDENRPLVVTRQHGLGRVTLMGVDVTDPRYVRMGMPSGKVGVWHRVFGFRGPILPKERVEKDINEGRMIRPSYRRYSALDDFLGVRMAMRETAVVPLTLAALFFILYWFTAGPGGFFFLRSRGLARHNWLLFIAVTAGCSLVAWGGALALRPAKAKIAHVSVMDIDAVSSLVHIKSWASIFVPEHGPVELAIDDPAQGENRNVIAAVGVTQSHDRGSFLDPQRYEIDAASPHRMTVPFRATAKQVEIDFLGPASSLTQEGGKPWVVPVGELREVQGWPSGKLTHNLPGTLRDALVVYQPGKGGEPWVWRLKAWPAGDVIEIKPPTDALWLAITPRQEWDQWEGHLGRLMAMKAGREREDRQGTGPPVVSSDRMIQAIEMLSFYDSLPPPQYAQNEDRPADPFAQNFSMPVAYERSVGRAMDLTRMVPLRRVIIIGHLEGTEMPVPLSVDGRKLPPHQDSWTVVRWISPLLN